MIIVILVVLVLLVFLVSKAAKAGKESEQRLLREEAEAIASRVTTPKQFTRLSERREDAQIKGMDAETPAAIDKAEHKIEVLILAEDIAGERTCGWWVDDAGPIYKTEEEALKHTDNPDLVEPVRLDEAAEVTK